MMITSSTENKPNQVENNSSNKNDATRSRKQIKILNDESINSSNKEQEKWSKEKKMNKSQNLNKPKNETNKNRKENEAEGSSSKKRRLRRKRNNNNATTNTQQQLPLQGYTIGVSVLERKKATSASTTENEDQKNDIQEEGETEKLSYKSIVSKCKSLGATVTSQISKRVTLVLCTPWAVTNLTQRVRKALTKNVDLVHVDWILQCCGGQKKVDYHTKEFLLNEIGEKAMKFREDEKKKKEMVESMMEKNETVEKEEEYDENKGWTEPVELGCCCVCHENGDLNCPWCVDCPFTIQRKKELNL